MIDKKTLAAARHYTDIKVIEGGGGYSKAETDALLSEKADKSTTYTKNEVDNAISTMVTGLDWKETVNTFSDIATTYPNPEDGWTVNVKDTNITYQYDEVKQEWIPISANAIPKATASVDGLLDKDDFVKLQSAFTKEQVDLMEDEIATAQNKYEEKEAEIKPSDDYTSKAFPTTIRSLATDGTDRIVAVCENSPIFLSTDGGENYQNVGATQGKNMNEIIHTQDGFVTVGAGANIYYSANGSQPWTKATVNTYDGEYNVLSVAYDGDGNYIAVDAGDGQNGSYILTASDLPSEWTQSEYTLPYSQKIRYVNGHFVIVGYELIYVQKSDKSGWDTISGFSRLIGQDIAYGNGKYVIVGYGDGILGTDKGAVYISSDLTTWEKVGDYDFPAYHLIFAGGIFFATGAEGKTWYSADGLTWKAGPDTGDNNNDNGLSLMGGRLVFSDGASVFMDQIVSFGYDITLYGYGNPSGNEYYTKEANIGKYYLDQSTGNVYLLSGTLEWSLEDTLDENTDGIKGDILSLETEIQAISGQLNEKQNLILSNPMMLESHSYNRTETALGALATRLEATYTTTETDELLDGKADSSTTSLVQDIDAYLNIADDGIVGVEADMEAKTVTRIAGAVGKSAGTDFNSINAFGGRKRCNLADDGTVNAYYGGSGYVEDGSNGQVMVEQPKFYYKVVPLKVDKASGKGWILRKARYYVSDKPREGFKIHPEFVRSGKVKEKVYHSAFEGCLYDTSASAYITDDAQVADFSADKLSSIANAKPISGKTQNLTRANTRKLAENRGLGWEQMTVQVASATQLLMLIEYATFNMQQALSAGNSTKTDDGSSNMAENTGATSSLGNASGEVINSNGIKMFSYRGEEDTYANIWKWMDGLNKYGQTIYIADHSFADDTKTGYTDAGITACSANGYIKAFCYSEDFDWLFIPGEVGGDSALPVGDYYWYAAGWRVAGLGGYWFNGASDGAFCLYLGDGSSSRGRIIGGRLCYIPDTDELSDKTKTNEELTKIAQVINDDMSSVSSYVVASRSSVYYSYAAKTAYINLFCEGFPSGSYVNLMTLNEYPARTTTFPVIYRSSTDSEFLKAGTGTITSDRIVRLNNPPEGANNCVINTTVRISV